jgi:hypothetical protein
VHLLDGDIAVSTTPACPCTSEAAMTWPDTTLAAAALQDGDTKKAAAVLGLEVARNDQPAAVAGAQQQQVILQRVPGDPGQVCFVCFV